jgi:hypothetical protein
MLNKKLQKLVKILPHTKFLDSNNNRHLFTRHGLHRNKLGKHLVTSQIVCHILATFQHRVPSPVPLEWLKPSDETISLFNIKQEETKTMNSNRHKKRQLLDLTIFMVNPDNKDSDDDIKYKANLLITSKCTNSNFIMAHGGESYPLSNHLTDMHKSTNFIMLHQNIRGLTHKIDEFLISLSCINPQVLCVTEHHLQPDEINNIHLGQYTLGTYFCRRMYKYGGVSIFISKTYNFKR